MKATRMHVHVEMKQKHCEWVIRQYCSYKQVHCHLSDQCVEVTSWHLWHWDCRHRVGGFHCKFRLVSRGSINTGGCLTSRIFWQYCKCCCQGPIFFCLRSFKMFNIMLKLIHSWDKQRVSTSREALHCFISYPGSASQTIYHLQSRKLWSQHKKSILAHMRLASVV